MKRDKGTAGYLVCLQSPVRHAAYFIEDPMQAKMPLFNEFLRGHKYTGAPCRLYTTL